MTLAKRVCRRVQEQEDHMELMGMMQFSSQRWASASAGQPFGSMFGPWY